MIKSNIHITLYTSNFCDLSQQVVVHKVMSKDMVMFLYGRDIGETFFL